ncbi:Peptidase M16C associated [Slackia heliotrinireducens]|uniref:Predicted Zn-dependent peptidase, insulinase n=1 Tax=Slackia heliotrinireducens (strain ATCC 29202 / DSM 20476 / NCTC 11029 / RHS 1) TaxID=471855 RepID=C7N846_SLAHD|nr:insulinase family protein [Slackia heliotrinireducens]ACV23081.1 predicted Zn-dependent peptidase, insulinase [Slackia heliotrinireducens DSM 20476]VEH02055.1 Peptidase M16C associated [Slackia heliotrinireducens]
MAFEIGETLHGFRVSSVEPLSEIDGEAIVMRHERSGARLLFLKNEDENKAFSISFKTPPKDSTGVFHILEHSVLCGSEKFPVKEPFVNLLKTSMQTFLNAMTFPDKTMYPVASTNMQDLMNLTDVYMDAVLRPNIYLKRQLFEQEGWHYELDEADEGAGSPERLRYNGVVFNEMKGALSDPEDVLNYELNKALFPNTCYAFESGGHPRKIPTLTYEDYLDTHARHYRLDNSYIILYGDIDADRMLGHLDEEYLSVIEPRVEEGPNPIGIQEPLVNMDVVVPMGTAPENACVALGYVVGTARDFERVLATDVLLDALLGGNESPIKRALLDEELGGNVFSYLMDSQAQPVAMIGVRNAKPGIRTRLREVVEEQAAKLVQEGIPRDVLNASLSQIAFMLRERDRGIADGVPLAMNAMAGWLYDEDMPTTYLRYEEPLAHMREGLENGYFERLLDELIVKSNHKALVEVLPTEPEGEGEEAAELAEKLASMTEADKQAVRDDVALLRKHQETPDAPEDVAKLPMLHVSDIGPAKPDPAFEVLEDTPLTCLFHELPTRHIDYVYHYFDIMDLDWEDVPYLTLLSVFTGRLATATRSAAEVDVWTRQHLGSLHVAAEPLVAEDDPSKISYRLVVAASAVAEEIESLASIPMEVCTSMQFDDAGRMRDILIQRRVGLEQAFANNGHMCASSRVASYLMPAAVLAEQSNGVDYYRFLKDLLDHFDERFEGLKAKLTELQSRIFTRNGLVTSFVGSREELDAYWRAAGDLDLPEGEEKVRRLVIPEPVVKNEAFIVPTDVCYVSKGTIASSVGSYSGLWPVASAALSYNYLWSEVRVKGGAYGVGFRRTTAGFARFHTYRDPNIDESLRRFDEAAAWLAAFEPTQDEMEGYIVSTVATHDSPVKPKHIARRQDTAYFRDDPMDLRERRREEELSATPQSIRDCSAVLRKIADEGAWCVFGNENMIRSATTPLNVIDLLNE